MGFTWRKEELIGRKMQVTPICFDILATNDVRLVFDVTGILGDFSKQFTTENFPKSNLIEIMSYW